MKTDLFCYCEHEGWDKTPDSMLDSPQSIALCFGSPRLAKVAPAFEMLETLYPSAMIVGCSTAGEICNTQLHHDTLSVLVMQFSSTTLQRETIELAAYDTAFEAGRALASRFNQARLKGVFLLCDGLLTNGSLLSAGVESIFHSDIPVTGGLAGDNGAFEATWVYADRRYRSGVVTAVGFYGDALTFQHAYRGGWEIMGIERRITKAAGNVVYRIDGKPALTLYKKYLGELSAELPRSALLFPLSLHDPQEELCVRTILGVNEETDSITFAGEMPEGSTVTLMTASVDDLVNGADLAAAELRVPQSGSASACIAISCVGRQLVMGEEAEDELEAVYAHLPEGTPLGGFYSNGELAPQLGRLRLHNQTMTLTLISERPCTER